MRRPIQPCSLVAAISTETFAGQAARRPPALVSAQVSQGPWPGRRVEGDENRG